MKRSEIIKVIYDTMRDNHFGQYGEFYKMAENVLDSIEEAGMVPPMIEEKSFYLADNGEEIYATHEWEEE